MTPRHGVRLAAGLLLAPMSYQRLTDDDVYGLFSDVGAATSLPVIVYDNPGTTHFAFSAPITAATPSAVRLSLSRVCEAGSR